MLAAVVDFGLLVIVVLCSAQLLSSKTPAGSRETAKAENPQLPA
jgi:hypothetical protein